MVSSRVTPCRGELITMKPINDDLRSMADAIRALKSRTDIPKTKLSAITSAMHRCLEIGGAYPDQTPADTLVVRTILERASWQAAGIKKESWANMCSLLRDGMELAGIPLHRRRMTLRHSNGWKSSLAALPPEAIKRLSGFAGWCTAMNIELAAVTAAIFLQYWDHLHALSLHENIRERWAEARRAWNRWVATPGSGHPEIPSLLDKRFQSLSWAATPDTLQAAVRDWHTHLQGDELYDGPAPLRPATIKNYDNALRRHVTHLVNADVPLDSLQSLESLVTVAAVRIGMAAVRGDRSVDQAQASLHAAAQALMSISRFIAKPEKTEGYEEWKATFEYLRGVANKIRDKAPTGMVASNRERLAVLQDPVVGRLFRNLHLNVAERVSKAKRVSRRMAYDMQMASLHVLLLEAPLRQKNASSLDIGNRIVRPVTGAERVWRIAIPGSEMKGKRPLELKVGAEGSAFIDRYIETYRPLITKVPSKSLFCNHRGEPKKPAALSKQYSTFIERELGIQINPHLLRHYVALLWLEAMPGEYGPISKLLGHASVEVTERFYTGAETKKAQDCWHDELEKIWHQDRETAPIALPKPRKKQKHLLLPAE